MLEAANDIIIADVNPLWQWMRAVSLIGGAMFIVGYCYLAWRRRADRSLQANLLLAASAVLIANSIVTSTVVRWGEPISIRLPIVFTCVTVGLLCLLQPSRRLARNRKPGDLL